MFGDDFIFIFDFIFDFIFVFVFVSEFGFGLGSCVRTVVKLGLCELLIDGWDGGMGWDRVG